MNPRCMDVVLYIPHGWSGSSSGPILLIVNRRLPVFGWIDPFKVRQWSIRSPTVVMDQCGPLVLAPRLLLTACVSTLRSTLNDQRSGRYLAFTGSCRSLNARSTKVNHYDRSSFASIVLKTLSFTHSPSFIVHCIVNQNSWSTHATYKKIFITTRC